MKLAESLDQALKLLNTHQYQKGQLLLEKVLAEHPDEQNIHKLLVKIGFTTKNYQLVEKHLKSLLRLSPSNLGYIDPLVELFSFQKRWKDIAALYESLAKTKPDDSTFRFNCAYYLKLAGEYQTALSYYAQTLDMNISDAYEVYLNMANIYSDYTSEPDKAIELLLTAIDKFPNQDSLFYNLANVYEQLGDKPKALTYFQQAFRLNPSNYNALARQADINKITDKNDELIVSLKTILESTSVANDEKVNVAYALGKAYDDCKEYDLAQSYYQQANKLDSQNLPSYDAKSVEQLVDNIIATFDEDFFKTLSIESCDVEAPPVFICGMFRSGSTLCEQILSAHSEISIGGEQEFFHRIVVSNFSHFPLDVSKRIKTEAPNLLNQYLNEIGKFYKKGRQLTDKRPDNFLYLGLIKALMPKAKIIWTKRNILDNCLSVYFLRLGSSMPYATNIKNILHFYRQQERLMNHWKSVFADDVYELSYDSLIDSPESNMQGLLSFLGLDWQDGCLNFHNVDSQVKTASVWQVRQPLYKTSSGRWKHYRSLLSDSKEYNALVSAE